MIYRKCQTHKTITAESGFEFDSKLNAYIKSLAEKGIACEVQTNPLAGFLAFVKYTEVIQVPEDAKEEHELAGDHFFCGCCPMLARTSDGRFKNFRCKRDGKLHHIEESSCCNDFYVWAETGEWPERKE